jgi:hypothetical protein
MTGITTASTSQTLSSASSGSESASGALTPESASTYEKLDSAPTAAGSYYAVTTASETDHYSGSSAWKAFAISMAEVTPTIEITSRSYDGTPLVASASAAVYDGTITLAYYQTSEEGATSGGTLLSGAPTNAGYYYVVATASTTANCTGSQAVQAFTIQKATLDPQTPSIANVTMKTGLTLADVPLPSGWSWADSTTPLKVGVMSAPAIYMPDSSGNYNAVQRTLTFKVVSDASGSDGGTVDNGGSADAAASAGDVAATDDSATEEAAADVTARTGDNSLGTMALLVLLASIGGLGACALRVRMLRR